MEIYVVLLLPTGFMPKCISASGTDVIPVSTVRHTQVSVREMLRALSVSFLPVLLGSSSSDKWLFEDHTVCILKDDEKAALDSRG